MTHWAHDSRVILARFLFYWVNDSVTIHPIV
jgi:hypothetical protein